MARITRWDWLDLPAAQPDAEHLLSPTGQRGLVFARLCRHYGVSARRLALVAVTRRGPPLTPREVQRAIVIARLQVRRGGRVCEVCGRPLAPHRRNDAHHCTPACTMRGLRARRAAA